MFLDYFTKSWARRALSVVTLLMLGVIIEPGIQRLIGYGYYHRVVEFSMSKPEYHVGEILQTRLKIDRNMPDDCEHIIHRFIYNAETGLQVWAQASPGIAKNGLNQDVGRPVPAELPPGKYKYTFNSVNTCGHGFNLVVPSPGAGAEFTIVP